MTTPPFPLLGSVFFLLYFTQPDPLHSAKWSGDMQFKGTINHFTPFSTISWEQHYILRYNWKEGVYS